MPHSACLKSCVCVLCTFFQIPEDNGRSPEAEAIFILRWQMPETFHLIINHRVKPLKRLRHSSLILSPLYGDNGHIEVTWQTLGNVKKYGSSIHIQQQHFIGTACVGFIIFFLKLVKIDRSW